LEELKNLEEYILENAEEYIIDMQFVSIEDICAELNHDDKIVVFVTEHYDFELDGDIIDEYRELYKKYEEVDE